MKATCTLTYEGLQHVWNVLNRMPLRDRGEINKIQAFYRVAEESVNSFNRTIEDTMRPVKMLKEKANDFQRGKDSTADERFEAGEAYEKALAEANKELEKYARENTVTIELDRESFAFVKALYEKYITVSYHEEDNQPVAGVKGAADIRRFDETLAALDAAEIN